MNIRFKEPQRYRAVLIDESVETDRFLEMLLLDRGIVVTERYGSAVDAANLRSLPTCDLVIMRLQSIAPRTVKLLRQISERFGQPIVMIAETLDGTQIDESVAAGADAVLDLGPSSDRLRAAVRTAIAVRARTSGLLQRAAHAEQQLEDRKLVERAKAILMQQRGMAEPDAFRALQRTSMDRNEPLPAVARSIIAAKELLG